MFLLKLFFLPNNIDRKICFKAAKVLLLLFSVGVTYLACRNPQVEYKTFEIKPKTIVIMAAGDSITAASYPERLQELYDRDGKNIQVYNEGISGDTSGSYLAHLTSSRIYEQLNPHYVLLQLGTNDVRVDSDYTPTPLFRRNMIAIIGLLQQHRNPYGHHPFVIISTIPPIVGIMPHYFDSESQRRVVEEINPALFEIAREKQCPIIDTYDLFIKHPDLLPGIHPNEAGYQMMAENWHEFLQPFLDYIPFPPQELPIPIPAGTYSYVNKSSVVGLSIELRR